MQQLLGLEELQAEIDVRQYDMKKARKGGGKGGRGMWPVRAAAMRDHLTLRTCLHGTTG